MTPGDVDSSWWLSDSDIEGALLWMYKGTALLPELIGAEPRAPQEIQRRNDDGSVTRAAVAGNIHQLAAMGGVPLVTVDMADACDYDAETVDPKRWLTEQQQ